MTAAENPMAGTKMPLNFSEGLVSYDLKEVDWASFSLIIL
jgi:hypothetical protein